MRAALGLACARPGLHLPCGSAAHPPLHAARIAWHSTSLARHAPACCSQAPALQNGCTGGTAKVLVTDWCGAFPVSQRAALLV